MVSARLESGEIVTLAKDCGCVIHEGPHLLHMDEVDKRMNAPLRERALQGEWLAVKAFAEAELRRLGSKRREMERLKIAEIIKRPLLNLQLAIKLLDTGK